MLRQQVLRHLNALLAAAACLAAAPLLAQGVDTPEPGSIEAIAKATTEPRFLSPWVADVPERRDRPVADRSSSATSRARRASCRTPTKIYGYYRALAAAPHARARRGHRQDRGRPRHPARDRGRREEPRRPRAAPRGDGGPRRSAPHRRRRRRERIVGSVKPFYMLHGGLHSTETGSPEMLMELAYRLAVSEAPLHPRDPRPHRRAHQPGGRAGRPRPARWTGSTAT